MKNFKLRAMLLLAVLLCCGNSAFADTKIWQDSIKYTLCDDLTAYVSDAETNIKTANIPEKITYEGKDYAVTIIGYGAFYGCSSLASVIIPNSVTSIGSSAFNGCSSLASVVIPSSVTSIGSSAFNCCSSLASVVIPSSVTSIKEYAFSGCSSLASVVIPNSVTSIGEYAFSDCRSLASVVIPSSVTSIGEYAFNGCSSLFAYYYKKDGTATLLKAGPLSAEIYGKEAYNIPEKVTHDGTEYSVTSIGEYAFSDCSSLASVVIPNSVTSIGVCTFYGCYKLNHVTIGSGVRSIDETAFALNYFRGYEYICPKKVFWLGNTPPEGYENVKGEKNYVSNDSFTGLSNTKVYPFLSSMFEKDGIKYVGCPQEFTCSIMDCAKISADIPEQVMHEGKYYTVTSIEDYAFTDCELSSITIGSGLKSIGEKAFATPQKVIWLGNTPPEGYENVKGKYNYVSNDSFTGLSKTKVYPFLSSMFEKDGVKYVPVNPSERTCDAIDCAYDSTAANINIGKTVNYKGVELAVKDIRPYTCYGNKYIKSVKIDYGGVIGNSAFYACDSIASVDFTATKIGNEAFYDCEAITTARIAAKTIGASAFKNSATKEPAKFEINADTIEDRAFNSCYAITEAKITAKVIGAYAFAYSAGKEPAKFEIKADNIGDNAFTGCSKLEDAVLGESLESVGNSAFKDCASLKGITIPDSVTGIGGRCFSGCESLAYAKIGAGVSVIPDEAFNNCKSLPEITIPKTVERIGNNVFPGCFALADVTIADRETELKLGSNVKSPMFSSCPLKSVYIGGNITYGTTADDGYSPFYRNTSLETVRITDRETEISENEFYGCTSLKSVSMGDGIDTIGRYAFSGCSSLESFSFGTGLKSIGDEAFSDCTGMKKLVSKTAVPPVCGPQALDDINKWECTLYVPQESLDAYRSAAQWKEFFFLETGIKNVLDTPSSATESERYSTDGTRLASPQKGINIIRMSDGTVKKVLVK